LGCSNFNGAIGNWDVSSVIAMANMFRGASVFNQNIGAWNTSAVTNMAGMFRIATSFNEDISTKVINAGLPNEYIAWDVSNVITMSAPFVGGIFEGATAFNQDIGNWDTSSLVAMGGNQNGMFRNAQAFNKNINTKTK
jgi:surface protein